MEIRNLITFVQVAELNSFTKAAKALDYSQSTVSFQIKQLENELDCLLFERINHTITLTEKGKELLEFARQIRYLTDEFNHSFDAPHKISGLLRIAAPDSVCEDMMQTNYIDFYSKYPEISLKFVTGDTAEMFRLLDQNEADLMVTLDNHVYHKDYVIAREEPVKMYFVTGTNSPFATERELTLKDIANFPLILTERGLGYRHIFDEAMAKQSIEILPILEIGRTDIIVSMLESGVGVSFLPEFVTRKKVREGKLINLNVTDMQAEIWKQLIYHKNKWVTQSMEVLIEYIQNHEFGR
ncbi:MAG: LysR family transcriptional regulator [Clostridia bacterium]|nr:LysR family transcriptional regulator [Clostridia bacterium]